MVCDHAQAEPEGILVENDRVYDARFFPTAFSLLLRLRRNQLEITLGEGLLTLSRRQNLPTDFFVSLAQSIHHALEQEEPCPKFSRRSSRVLSWLRLSVEAALHARTWDLMAADGPLTEVLENHEDARELREALFESFGRKMKSLPQRARMYRELKSFDLITSASGEHLPTPLSEARSLPSLMNPQNENALVTRNADGSLEQREGPNPFLAHFGKKLREIPEQLWRPPYHVFLPLPEGETPEHVLRGEILIHSRELGLEVSPTFE